jgi:hypothetical protein
MADIFVNLVLFLRRKNLPTQLIRAVHTISGFDDRASCRFILPKNPHPKVMEESLYVA